MGSGMMPKKIPENKHGQNETELQSTIDKLNKMLANVLTYISDEEVEVIDFEYLLDHTDGLRQWWNEYQEANRKKLEDEIKKSLKNLSIKELKEINDKIKSIE